MNWIVVEVLNVALIAIEMIMLLALVNSVWKRRHAIWLTSFITLFMLLLLYCILALHSDNLSLRMVLSSLFLVTWMLTCYKTKLLQAIFTVLFLQAYFMLGDSISLALVARLTGAGITKLLEQPASYFLLCFCVKTIELLGIVCISLWLRQHFKGRSITWSSCLMALFLPITSLMISVCLLNMYTSAPEIAGEILTCTVLVLVMDVLSIFLLAFLEDQQSSIRDNEMLQQNIKAELDHVDAWKQAYAGQRKQTHDFQNQLLVIHGMVEQQAPQEEILAYLKHLQNTELPGPMLLNIHRTAINIILNQKLLIAKAKEINFRTQLDDLSAICIPDTALVTVLSNLIDNAIEACEQISQPQKRYILLKIRVEASVTFLYIENATNAPVTIRNNSVVTTKPEAREHGYGLKNVAAILRQYNAIYSLHFRPDDSVFSFSAQIDPHGS
ncbi:MAG: GHKL domain-containing protein [Clostridia bacterium]